MIDKMPCGYGIVRTTAVRIWHQFSHRACAEVFAAFEVARTPAQWSQQLQNLTILIVKFHIILNAPPSLQVLSEPCENALAESESTLQSSRGGWKHLEVLRSTGKGYRSLWEVCIWIPDRITSSSCSSWLLIQYKLSKSAMEDSVWQLIKGIIGMIFRMLHLAILQYIQKSYFLKVQIYIKRYHGIQPTQIADFNRATLHNTKLSVYIFCG